MTASLLQTKLYIPPVRPDPSTTDVPSALRTGLVSRPRLIERLNAGLGRNQNFVRKLTPMRSIGLIIRPGRLWQDDAAERMGEGAACGLGSSDAL